MIQKLLILCGIPFAGKSTLAHSLSQKYKMKRVDLDDVKFQLYGQTIKDEQLEQKA